MDKKRKLLVLGVAINNYALQKHNLKGCHNDLSDLTHYLNDYINQKEWKVHIELLKDQEATRQQIINSFLSLFGQLEDGDTGLFYFSGHGSQAHAPEVFWHELPERFHETIVCYDSRTSSRDLYDKELSYLIWKVTNGKQVHFTAIMDCCHAGSATRTPEKNIDNTTGVRMRDASTKKRNWKDYLGASEYCTSTDGVHTPIGKHILIAACRRIQKAKEKSLNFNQRGVFTYGLLEALRQSKGNITYGLLLQKTQAIVYNFTQNQHPQLEAHGIHNVEEHYFLNGGLKRKEKMGLVYYDLNQEAWIFNQGTIHGILNPLFGKNTIKYYTKTSFDGQTNLTNWEEAELTDLYANYSIVNIPNNKNKTKQFPATIYRSGLPKLRIWLTDQREEKTADTLEKLLKEQASTYLAWSPSKAAADYTVLIEKHNYTIQSPRPTDSFLKKILRNNKKSTLELISKLEHITAWQQIKGITNPGSKIRNEELKLSFFRIKESSEDGLEVLEEDVVEDFLSNAIELRYLYNKSILKWKEPAFRLKLETPLSNRRPLWISLLFFGTDYSITNELCPSTMLQPGESQWLEAIDHGTGFYTKIIPLHLKKTYFNKGIHSIVEHFKLFIATEEFDTRNFQQNSLALSDFPGQKKRGLFRIKDLEQLKFIDWRVIDFSVKIIRPFL